MDVSLGLIPLLGEYSVRKLGRTVSGERAHDSQSSLYTWGLLEYPMLSPNPVLGYERCRLVHA